MADGSVPRELVDATPVLEEVIAAAGEDESNKANQTFQGETYLVTEIHRVIAAVAVNSYKAGVAAMASVSRYYEDPNYALARLNFRADIAVHALQNPDEMTSWTL